MKKNNRKKTLLKVGIAIALATGALVLGACNKNDRGQTADLTKVVEVL